MSEAIDNIKRNLCKLRKSNKLSMREVAEALGVKENTYRVWEDENNKTVPKSEIILQLAKLFDVSVDFLFRSVEDNILSKENRVENRTLSNSLIYGDSYISELSPEERITVMKLRRMNAADKHKVFELIDSINEKIDNI